MDIVGTFNIKYYRALDIFKAFYANIGPWFLLVTWGICYLLYIIDINIAQWTLLQFFMLN